MKTKKKKLEHRLLSGALLLLGFTACGEVADEYGTPIVDFQVKGRVTSEDGKPLQGIQAVVKGYYSYQKEDGTEVYENDTVYTDADGRFVSHKASTGWVDSEQLVLHDIDGEANGGTFKSDSLKLTGMDRKQIKKGDKHWYQGMYEYSTEMTLSKEEQQKD